MGMLSFERDGSATGRSEAGIIDWQLWMTNKWLVDNRRNVMYVPGIFRVNQAKRF